MCAQGYWISNLEVENVHDCATAGHMPDACPGGKPSSQVEKSEDRHCYQTTDHALNDNELAACNEVIGSTCSPGYWGDGCTKCCKPGTCTELRGVVNPDTHQEYKAAWYFTESEGRCKECPEQNVWQLAVFGTVVSLFVAEKLLKFAEVAKLSGALHAPLVSLVNFFQ